MDDSLAEYYYEKINKTENIIGEMVNFYKSLFNIDENLYTSVYQTFGRLIKIYGKDVIYFSLLDASDINNIDFNGIGKLLSYLAKKRLAEKFIFNAIPSLDRLAEKNMKELEKERKLKIPGVFDE